jgi:hypothetical protein
LNKISLSLQHHDEAVATLFQIIDVVFTEIAPVQNKPDFLIAVAYRPVHCTLELGDIVDAPRIQFIK